MNISQALYIFVLFPPNGIYIYLISHLLKLACQYYQNWENVTARKRHLGLFVLTSIPSNKAQNLKKLQMQWK